jgi:hypothetical protein
VGLSHQVSLFKRLGRSPKSRRCHYREHWCECTWSALIPQTSDSQMKPEGTKSKLKLAPTAATGAAYREWKTLVMVIPPKIGFLQRGYFGGSRHTWHLGFPSSFESHFGGSGRGRADSASPEATHGPSEGHFAVRHCSAVAWFWSELLLCKDAHSTSVGQ